MSTERDGNASASAADQGPALEQPLDWLLGALQQAMEELIASDATPLQKASAAARLGGLYLKTYQTAGLEKENRALTERVGDLEQRLAGAHAEIDHMHSVAAEWVEWLERTDPTANPWRERAGLPPSDEPGVPAQPRAFLHPASTTVSRFDGVRTLLDPAQAVAGVEVADPPDPAAGP
jgi:hypothetical protein